MLCCKFDELIDTQKKEALNEKIDKIKYKLVSVLIYNITLKVPTINKDLFSI